jgi:predicted nucleotidyltransferase
MKAFLDFGLPTTSVDKNSFLTEEEVEVYRFGIEPSALDLIIAMKAMPFEKAYNNAKWRQIDTDLKVRLINLPELIALKEFAGRSKDLSDLEHLPPAE